MRQREGAGNGSPCPGDDQRPLDKRHGRMFILPSGRAYCAHQSHDNERTTNLFENDGTTPVVRKDNANGR